MVGTDRRSRLLTCTDRKRGYELAAKLDRVAYDKVADEIGQWFSRLPRAKKHTLTFDNGIGFNQFEYIEATTGLAVNFCHPYSSWEHGTNENTNGLLPSTSLRRVVLSS
jgi:transposase, IS30 family